VKEGTEVTEGRNGRKEPSASPSSSLFPATTSGSFCPAERKGGRKEGRKKEGHLEKGRKKGRKDGRKEGRKET
jgi:hypothetical protein